MKLKLMSYWTEFEHEAKRERCLWDDREERTEVEWKVIFALVIVMSLIFAVMVIPYVSTSKSVND